MPERSRSTSIPAPWISFPSSRIWPASMGSIRLMVRMRVDLPEPEGPQTTTTSPVAMVSLTSSSARYEP